MSPLLSVSRYLALIPVVCLFLAATALILFGAASTVQLLFGLMASVRLDSTATKDLLVKAIELADLFLLGTVLYVIAVGFYELFIDDTLKLPAWLVIHDLDDLKDKLIGVVIVVLGVVFLGQVITWDGQRDLLRFGGAVAAVIAALAYFLGQKPGKAGKNQGR
ncbi:MAG: YqhA family protein [Chloroflexi bacterium OHK40]